MDTFLLRQEIICNCWLLLHIFICSKFIWGERSKRDWFPTKYFSYVHWVCRPINLIGILMLWSFVIIMNVFYVLSFFIINCISEDNLYLIAGLIGAIVVIVPSVVDKLTLHYRSGSPYSSDKQASKLLHRNRKIFFVQSAVTLVLIMLSMFTIYITTKSSRITYFIGAILNFITFFSVYVYYTLKLKRELIYQSFKLVLQNKIKNLVEWSNWLKLPQRQLQKLKHNFPRLLIIYGFDNKIELHNDLFKVI